MTRRKWLIFAGTQFVGCVGAVCPTILLAFYGMRCFDLFAFRALATTTLLLLPGYVVAGALTSTVGFYLALLPLSVAVNAAAWTVSVVVWRRFREHMTGLHQHRYTLAFAATTAVFLVVNIAHFMRRPTCYDCFLQHGLPFPLYHEGGFLGGGAIMWGGLAADILIVTAAATMLGSAWQWRSGKRAV